MADAVTRYGSGEHSIFHGDALIALDQIADQSCSLIFADPPYNIGKKFVDFHDRWADDRSYADWCSAWLDKCVKKLTPNGSMYVMCSTQSIAYLDLHLRQTLDIRSRIAWHYDSSGVQARKMFGSLWEPILHCVVDPKNYVFNAEDIEVEAKTGAQRKLVDYRKDVPRVYSTTKVPGNAWYFPRVRYRMPEYESHPTQKPEALLERVILASSNPGDLVLDPFSGTFTTSAVAQRLERRTAGIEIAEEYVGIGLRRLGLAVELNGRALEPVQKNTKRRSSSASSPSEPQMELILP